MIPTAPLVLGSAVSGILPLSRWDHYLWCHPDKEFGEFLCRGIDQGFKIGFNRFHELRPLKRNYESSVENPGHAQQYIDEEVSAGCLRPLPPAEGLLAHWSPISMVPKDHQPGKFRLIIDLSAPVGGSVNEGIDLNLTSLTYPRVEDAVRFRG